jgi:hypothetical protein
MSPLPIAFSSIRKNLSRAELNCQILKSCRNPTGRRYKELMVKQTESAISRIQRTRLFAGEISSMLAVSSFRGAQSQDNDYKVV